MRNCQFFIQNEKCEIFLQIGLAFDKIKADTPGAFDPLWASNLRSTKNNGHLKNGIFFENLFSRC